MSDSEQKPLLPPTPRYPKKTSRAELLAAIRERALSTTEKTLDVILDEMERFAKPYLDNDWSGGEVLHQIRMWRRGPR
jgi:hypothetical protein